ncbi:MAG: hypothetical protein L0387_12100 [Acidobacteria bacterium]|nr:hypothetical protein [Acidobacteriota bacterium]MCI0721302.1 hypothetical protein [Acidobacteriota bacterium]
MSSALGGRAGEDVKQPQAESSSKSSQAASGRALAKAFAELLASTPPRQPCDVLECRRKKEYEAMLHDVVQVLEATRKSFKSHQLGELRKRVVEVLRRNA